MNIDKIWQSAVHTLDEHKATDIKVLEVSSITSIADYFLIASVTAPIRCAVFLIMWKKNWRKKGFVRCVTRVTIPEIGSRWIMATC